MKLIRPSDMRARAVVQGGRIVRAARSSPGQLRAAIMAAASLLRTWRLEVLAFVSPFVVLAIGLELPIGNTSVADNASIANIAAVQGAVTGLSLIALVLAIEMARRQEDRDDVVYEIMLREAWIRPVFTFAIAALVSTLVAMAVVDMSTADTVASNLLLTTYALVSLVSLTLLFAVLRTIHVLRPTGVIAFRNRANEDERRRRINRFLAQRRGQLIEVDEPSDAGRIAYGDPRTFEERLFTEIDAALTSKAGNRFEWAMNELQNLIEASADQIAASDVPFQSPGQGAVRWYPLDALNDRLPPLWRSVYRQEDSTFALALSSLQYWLLMKGAEQRSGELFELGLQSGLASYRAATPADRADWRLSRRDWSNLSSAAWWRLFDMNGRRLQPGALPFAMRVVKHLQTYGTTLLVNDDLVSFTAMSEGFHDAIEDLFGLRTPLRYDGQPETQEEFQIRQQLTFALLALSGRAILLEHTGEVKDASLYVQALARVERALLRANEFIPAMFDGKGGVQSEWGWWELPSEPEAGGAVRWIKPKRYAMVGLLYWLHKDPSSGSLPAFGGYAQQFIDEWQTHSDIILKVAGVKPGDREKDAQRLLTRLQTSVAAEGRERDDRTLCTPLDPTRVDDFKSELRKQRGDDRVLEHRFAEAERVRRLDDAEWPGGRFAHAWLLPREPFTLETMSEPLHIPGLALSFERGLFVEFAKLLEGGREMPALIEQSIEDLLSAIDNGLVELAADHPLIILYGKWPDSLIGDLWIRSDLRRGPLSFGASTFRQAQVAYRGHWLVQSGTDANPALLMLDLDRWGWLVRASIDGEDFGLDLREIDREEAERMVNDNPVQGSDREERIRQEMLKVKLIAKERVKFEVENADAALRIPVQTADET